VERTDSEQKLTKLQVSWSATQLIELELELPQLMAKHIPFDEVELAYISNVH
jgi:hypothetical protein